MSLEERNDFFVQRRQMISRKTNEKVYIICAEIKDNEIDSNQRDYIPSKDFRTTNNISRIRIPAALFVADEVSDLSLYNSLIENHRKQVGAHLIVNSKGCLCYVYTNLDQNQNYVSSNLRYINDVYPCFVNPDSQSQLCLGLRFTTNLNEGFRSFSRTQFFQSPSGGVFDLTEELIDPKRLKTGIRSKQNRKLFPKYVPQGVGKKKRGDHYAIYLCAGAKLIVEDDRFFELTDEDSSNLGKKMNNSLFQSGSLVVFTGLLVFQTSYSLTKDEKGEPFEGITHIDLNTAVTKKIIEPEDGLFKDWFRVRGLYDSYARVIFLGHNYSVHNSICWRLRINYLKPENNKPFVILTAPEGARIVDIQNWDRGMAEIYWRHCFERLYEKVLVQAVSNVYDQSHHFNYYRPTIKGKNTFYWERKILGVGGGIFSNFNSWKINLKYKYKDQSSVLIPPYYEQYIDWVETVPPFAPPLHPPIYFNRQFYYLPYKTCPEYLVNQLVNIRGQLFRIKYKEGVEEYHWSEPQRVSLYQNKSFSTEERVGIDLLVYRKQNSVIGRKILFYLELYSNQMEEQSEELIGQWIELQNINSDNIPINKRGPQKPIENRKQIHKTKKGKKTLIGQLNMH